MKANEQFIKKMNDGIEVVREALDNSDILMIEKCYSCGDLFKKQPVFMIIHDQIQAILRESKPLKDD